MKLRENKYTILADKCLEFLMKLPSDYLPIKEKLLWNDVLSVLIEDDDKMRKNYQTIWRKRQGL